MPINLFHREAAKPTVTPPPAARAARAGREGYVTGIPIGGATETNPGTVGALSRTDQMQQLMMAYIACPWVADCIDVTARTCTAGGIQCVPNNWDLEKGATLPEAPPEVKEVQNLLEWINPYDDARQLFRSMITDLLIFGDSFTEVVYLMGKPVALYALAPQTMTVMANEHGVVQGYFQQMQSGRTAHFAPRQVVHVKLDAPGNGGLYGISPTQKTLLPIETWLFTMGLLKETMKRGDPLRAHVDWPIALPESEMRRLQQQYAIRNLGAKNIGNLFETKGGAAVRELGTNQVDHWLSVLQQRRDEIISGFGVPPSKVGVIEAGNLGGGTATSQTKALALSTPIPTPQGWTTMGELRVGDIIFDEAGSQCQVTSTTDIPQTPAYRFHFSDGTSIDCADDHLWTTWTARDRRSWERSADRTIGVPQNWAQWRSTDQTDRYNAHGPTVRTSAAIVATLQTATGKNNHSIPVCGPLDCEASQTPIDPYILGFWLGDGVAHNGLMITGLRSDHEEVCRLFEASGARILNERTQDNRCWLASISLDGEPTAPTSADRKCVVPTCVFERTNRTVKGWCSTHLARFYRHGDVQAEVPVRRMGNFLSALRSLDLVDNKHVPDGYLRGSTTQRLALLQGLMDTDGGWAGTCQVRFSNKNEKIADAVLELARSLGQKPVKSIHRATLYGVDKGPVFWVTWTPTIQVFRLSRKASLFSPSTRGMRVWSRTIVSAERLPIQPMKCIRVDSPNHLFLAGEGMIPTHNTFRVNTCGPLQELVLEKFTSLLLYVSYGIKDWHLQFGDVDWRDDEIIETIRDMRLRNGSWLLNRYRSDIGEPPVTGGDNAILVDRQNLIQWSDLNALSKANVAAIQAQATAAKAQASQAKTAKSAVNAGTPSGKATPGKTSQAPNMPGTGSGGSGTEDKAPLNLGDRFVEGVRAHFPHFRAPDDEFARLQAEFGRLYQENLKNLRQSAESARRSTQDDPPPLPEGE